MIKDQLEKILHSLPKNVTLITVSKTHPVSAIKEAYEAGQRHFGENKVQELIEKQIQLPADIHWHLIGHLQTNKVKYIAPFVSYIHSVDSLKLLQEINKQAKNNGRKINCLLQFHIAQEETKFGLSVEESFQLLKSETFKEMKNISIVGIMGMASFTNDNSLIRNEFKLLNGIFNTLKNEFFEDQSTFKEISMGMSGDFGIAIEEGSTMIRVGSLIFGAR